MNTKKNNRAILFYILLWGFNISANSAVILNSNDCYTHLKRKEAFQKIVDEIYKIDNLLIDCKWWDISNTLDEIQELSKNKRLRNKEQYMIELYIESVKQIKHFYTKSAVKYLHHMQDAETQYLIAYKLSRADILKKIKRKTL